MYMGFPENRAREMATRGGDEWIERNRNAIDLLPNVTIIRWEDWRKKPEWPKAVEETNRLYNEDSEFRRIVDETALIFWERKSPRVEADKEKSLEHSRRYILEEVAFALISSFQNIADIYPGTFPPIFDYMRSKNIPAPVSMTSVTFRRRPGMKSAVGL